MLWMACECAIPQLSAVELVSDTVVPEKSTTSTGTQADAVKSSSFTVQKSKQSGSTMPSKQAVKIIFVGDSITGWSDLSKWFKYSHIIECMIEGRCGPDHSVVLNRGIGGDTTAGLLSRLDQDVLRENPDIVVLLAGGNDANLQETALPNLDLILARTLVVCPRILVMQYHPVMLPSTAQNTWALHDPTYEIIAAAAAKHNCPILDMAEPMNAAADNSVAADEKDFRKLSTWHGLSRYRTCDLVGPDGIHMNGAGEIVYARSIFAKLLALGWLPKSVTE